MSRSASPLASRDCIRVGIVGYGLDRPTTGISRYTIELLRALRRNHPDIHPILLLPFDTGSPELAELAQIVRLRSTRLLPAMMTIGPAQLAIAARRLRLHILHDPTGIAPFLAPRRLDSVPRIATIHDAVPFVYPLSQTRLTNWLFHRYLPISLRHTNMVVTTSEVSRLDLMRFLHVPARRMTVIPLGVSERFRPMPQDAVDRVVNHFRIKSPYLLAVGSLEPRKNLPALFEAYGQLRQAGLRHSLVVVGKKAWKSAAIFRRLQELRLEDHVLLTGYVDDADLPALYTGAACFVFPSLYEGFGFPPLEAMACGTPVVASNTSSLPGVIGDAGLLVDPTDVHELVASVRRILENAALAQELRTRGLARVSTFTWTRTADRHAALYHSVVDGERR